VQAQEEAVRRSASSFLTFVNNLRIPSATGPRLFCTCMADFQQQTFEAISPSLQAVRDGRPPERRRFWIERTKKAAKDSDLACMVLWLMAFPRRPMKIQICAANSLQASIVSNRAVEIIHYNPWLADRVEVVQYYIRNNDKRRSIWTHIESTSSSKFAGEKQGEAPDVLILNELVHVAKWEAMQAHMSNAAGVPRCLVIVSTNAGIKGSQAEAWRKEAESRPDRWKMLVLSKLAPWVDLEDVAENRRLDPIGIHSTRWWEGKWVDRVGGAVSEAAIERSFVLDGPSEPVPGWVYLMAFDMGETHDHSAAVVIGVNQDEQKIRLFRFKAWKPSVPNNKGVLEVDEDAMNKWLLRMAKKYRIVWAGYDPAVGGRFLAQKLRKRGLPMAEVSFNSSLVQTQMATAFVQCINDGVLECYDEDDSLHTDFRKFDIQHTPPNKYKLVAVSDEQGHADIGISLAMTLPKALAVMEVHGWLSSEDDLVVSNDPLTEEEEEGMDPELKELYDELGRDEYKRGRRDFYDD